MLLYMMHVIFLKKNYIIDNKHKCQINDIIIYYRTKKYKHYKYTILFG